MEIETPSHPIADGLEVLEVAEASGAAAGGLDVDFIRRNGPEVAALAWGRYEEKGRGMVCVIAEEHNEVLGTVPYDFRPAARSGFIGANCPRCGRGFNARRSALTS